MANKKVYVLNTGQLSSVDNKFHFYDTEVYSSRKRLMESLNYRIEENRATEVQRDFIGECDLFIDYSYKGLKGNSVRGRYHIMEKALK